MGGILDYTFRPYLQRQLNARQDLLRQTNRDSRFYQYTTGKNSWCRMTSLVNYDSPDGKYKGDQLSRKYVLEAGTLYPNPSNPNQYALRRGINNAAGSYGSLGDGSYGIRPMPGIVSIDLKNKGALGSTKEAIVKFMAWDKGQFEDLEILFQRVGYSVLIEFGWSLYLDTYVKDSGSNSTKVVDSIPLPQVKMQNFNQPTINAFDVSLTPPDLYNKFEYLRHKFSGNYEGFVGKIRNFSWEMLDNGGYECTCIVIAIGDVIDSLKINSSTYPLNDQSQTNTNKTNGRLLTRFEQIFTPIIDQSDPTTQYNYIVNNVLGQNYNIYNSIVDLSIISIPYSSVPSSLMDKGYKNLQGALHYMSLGAFSAIMNVQFGVYDPRNGNNVPLINLEMPMPGAGSYGNGLCICSEDTISIDPMVCLINNPNAKFVVDGINGFVPDIAKRNTVKTISLKPFPYQAAKNVGVIGNIYLCIEYVVNKFRELASQSDTVDMHKFIHSILDDISYAMGSVNNFGLYVDDSTAAIIDANFVEDPSVAKNDRFIFNYFGNNSTVRKFNITSKIFESQATMVAIGAGARANIAGIQTSTYNLLNKGLSDRLVLQTLDADAINSLQNSVSSGSNAIQQQDDAYKKQLAQMVIDLRTYVQSYLNKGDLSQVLSNKQAANSNLNSVIVKINTDTNFKALIPISLELTVDGISGIVIGNVFRLNSDTLPRDYVNKNLAFRVVGLWHHIEDSDWVTTLVTQCCLLDSDIHQQLNSIDKISVNNVITGIQDAQQQSQQQSQQLDLQKQVYIFNNLMAILVSIFGPNNTDAMSTINQLILNNTLFQPGTQEIGAFDYNYIKDTNTHTITATKLTYVGYPLDVVNRLVQRFIDFGAPLNRAKTNGTGGIQWILNPVVDYSSESTIVINTLITEYPDYQSMTNSILVNAVNKILVSLQQGSENIMIPIYYVPQGGTAPIINRNIPLDTELKSSDNF